MIQTALQELQQALEQQRCKFSYSTGVKPEVLRQSQKKPHQDSGKQAERIRGSIMTVIAVFQ
jgi:hypothetical protein